jgi:hypothetical protein
VPVDRQDLSARHGIDAQVAPSARWLELLTEATHRTAVGAVEPTLTHLLGQSGSRAGPVHKRRAPRPVARPQRRPAAGSMLCGCFKAMSRDASAAGGLDRRFARHGRKDIDPCVRLWRLGLKCLVEPRAVVAHRFRRASIDVAVAEDAVHNLLWIASLHFTPQKLGSLLRTRGR